MPSPLARHHRRYPSGAVVAAKAAAAALVLTAAVALAVGGCAGEEDAAGSGETPPGAEGSAPASLPAVYFTDLAFVSFGEPSARVYFHFLNRTSSDELARNYRSWIEEDGSWRETLSFRDTLPTPRAAWRVLPARSLRIRVTGEDEISGLRRRSAGPDLHLAPEPAVTEWTGPTGQRETLHRAFLESGDERTEGLAVQRRRARPLEEPAPRTVTHLLLLTFDRGGVLILADRNEEDTLATARTWIEGQQPRREEVELSSLEGEPGWAVRLPRSGITGIVRPGPVATDELGEGDAGLRMRSAEGELRLGGRPLSAPGISVELRGP